MSRRGIIVLICGLLLSGINNVYAEQLLMVRTELAFPEAMLELQTQLRKHGYTPSRVQRVDIGLTKFGYKTDKYRVVFFGKLDQVKMIAHKYPEMVPYLPLKISIFAEHNQTILATMNPIEFNHLFPNVKLDSLFTEWEKDIREIFQTLRNMK